MRPWAHSTGLALGALLGLLACPPAFTCQEDAQCDAMPGGRCGDDGQCDYSCADSATGTTDTTACGTSTTLGPSTTTTTTTTTTGTTADPPVGCGDGVLEPGDVCFGAIQTLEYGSRGVALGDLDNDDDLDLVIPLGGLFAAFNDGGVFTDPVALPTGGLTMMGIPDNGDIASAAIGDLDGDGAADVIARGGLLSLLRNKKTADGTFELRANHPACPRYEVRSVAIDDLDGDGVRELLIHHQDCLMPAIGVGIYNLDADAAALKPSPIGPITPLLDAPAMAVADLDGDGHKDVLTGNALFLRMAGAWVQTDLPPQGGVDHLTTALLDDDPYPDIAMVVLNKVQLVRHLDGAPATFAAPEMLSLFGTFHSVAAGDLDNDGLQDLVLGESSGGKNTLRLLRNNGYPGADFDERKIDLGAGTKVPDLALGHLNDDYALDIVVSVNPPVGQTLILLAAP